MFDQVDQLLETGADPKATDKRKISALHYACAQGRLEVVQRLYRRGVELDVEDTGMSCSLLRKHTCGNHCHCLEDGYAVCHLLTWSLAQRCIYLLYRLLASLESYLVPAQDTLYYGS